MVDTPDRNHRVTDAGSCSTHAPHGEVVLSPPLRAQLQSLSQLAGYVSHALRNPLMAVTLHADILHDELSQLDGSDQAQLRRSLAVIRDNTTRSHELMQHYLLVARLSDAPRETVELGSYMAAFCAEMRTHLAAHGITLRWEGTEALGFVALHQPSFRQALLHLLHHAEAVVPEQGTVTIRGYRFAAHVCLEVHEADVSISHEDVTTVFDLSAASQPQTRGLGLALTREVVRAHQGEITVTSESGGGMTFTVQLPLLDKAP